VDRRRFVGSLGALGAGALLGCGGRDSTPRSEAAQAEPDATQAPATLGSVGLQLYTVRRLMQRDFEGTLRQVAEVGYREVEFAGYFGKSPQQVRDALAAAGLAAPSAHVPVEALAREWGATLEAARTIGHRYLVVAWLPEHMRRTLDEWRRAASLFSQAGLQSMAAGVSFAYHNHDFEFAPLEGRVPYDVLIEESDPTYVKLELDLYWITRAGADPLAYFARFPGRFPMLHVKDMDAQRRMVDVGAGTIDWRRILAQRAQAGSEHFFVEHDEPRDPMASVRASYGFLSRLEI
jgi:sugar phosphate isomerase/epimerase